jgi:hypothetical protein
VTAAGDRAFEAVLRELGIDGLALMTAEQLAELRAVAADLSDMAERAERHLQARGGDGRG